MKTRLLLVAVIALLSIPAWGQAPDGNLRVLFSSANPMGSWNGDFNLGGINLPVQIEADSTGAVGLVYEVRMGNRWGVESGLYFADFDFQITSSGISTDLGSALAIPVVLGADFHVVSGERVDAYLGPQLSYTFWGNLDSTVGSTEIDGDFGVGAVAGLDVRLGGGNWTLSFAARYLGMALSDPSLAVDVDPLFAEFGVGYRF